MHVKICRMYPQRDRRLFLDFHDLWVQRYSDKEETKQSLHFKDFFEYKEYIVNI